MTMTKILSKWHFRFGGESFNQTDLTHQQINMMAPMLGLTTHMNIIVSQITRNSTVCSAVCQADTKENIKAPCHGPFVSMDSPHKGPVTRKEFPCHDVIMFVRSCQKRLSNIKAHLFSSWAIYFLNDLRVHNIMVSWVHKARSCFGILFWWIHQILLQVTQPLTCGDRVTSV